MLLARLRLGEKVDDIVNSLLAREDATGIDFQEEQQQQQSVDSKPLREFRSAFFDDQLTSSRPTQIDGKA